MHIELVTIGGELLNGHTINTNAAWLSQQLTHLGMHVVRHTVIADEIVEIEKIFLEAMQRSPIVISTGGLGPTIDDLTREAAFRVCQSTPKPLQNSIGAAKGALYEEKQSALILLPGVPREMQGMFEHEVLPFLKEKDSAKRFACCRSICLFKEREVDPFLRQLQKNHPHVEFGIYPSQGTLLVEFCGSNRTELEELCSKLESKYKTFVFKEEKIAEALHSAFISKGKTLALAESCTGGAVAASLTALPSASKFLLGSIVAYCNSWKESFLNVSSNTVDEKGAVSFEAVEEMVSGLFEKTDADFAAAISGIAGPAGGSSEKPVGSIYIAIGKRGEKTDIGLVLAPSDRASAIDFSVKTTMAALWRRLVHNKTTFQP